MLADGPATEEALRGPDGEMEIGSPYATQKARTMLAGDFTPAFALKHALKDANLAAIYTTP